MAYFDVAALSADLDFRDRVTACYVTETPTDNEPVNWMGDHIWQIASAPTFGDKYASAIAGGVDHPGRDQSVIADGEILSAVQAVLAQP